MSFDSHGFDEKGVHKGTGLPFDEHGFRADGVNKDTGVRRDRGGFNIDGQHISGKDITRPGRLHAGMTLNSEQPREQDGKFGEKTGSAPEPGIDRSAAANIPLASTNLDGTVSAEALAQSIRDIDPATVKSGDFGQLYGAVERLQAEAAGAEGRAILNEKREDSESFIVAMNAYGDARVVGYTDTEGVPHKDVPAELDEWFRYNSTYFERPGALSEYFSATDEDDLSEHDIDTDDDPCYLV